MASCHSGDQLKNVAYMMNEQLEYRNQKSDHGTGSMSYHNECSPDRGKDTKFGVKMQGVANPLEWIELGSNGFEGTVGDRQDASEDQPNILHKSSVALGVVLVGSNCGDVQNRGHDWILKDYKPHHNICYKDPFPY